MTVMISMTSEEKPGVTRTPAEVIMSIEKSPAHKLIRKIWSVDRKAFENLKWDEKEEARQLRAKVYYAVSMSLIFQGVIFTAVSQTNLLSCSLVWSPICLSAFVGLASMLVVRDKLYELGTVKHDIKQSNTCIDALVGALELLDKQGADMDLDEVNSKPTAYVDDDSRPDGLKELKSWYALSAQFFLFFFSLIISVFSQRTLCHNCKSCGP